MKVGDQDVAEPLGGERSAEVLEKTGNRGGPEGQGARLGHHVGRGVHDGEPEKDAVPVTRGEKAQDPLGEAFPLEGIGTEGKMGPVHFQGRTGGHHHAARSLELVEGALGEALPAQHAGQGVRFHGATLPGP